jgi:hypothetical protein
MSRVGGGQISSYYHPIDIAKDVKPQQMLNISALDFTH